MRRRWEWLGRAGYRLVIYITAHQRLRIEMETGESDAAAVRSVMQQMGMRFELDRHEWALLATALRTAIGLEADTE